MFVRFKLFFVISLVGILTLSTIVPSAFAAEHSFTDVNTNYEEAVSFLYEFELIQGVTAASPLFRFKSVPNEVFVTP